MVREKLLVVRGEIWTIFAIFMFHYILIRLHTNYFVVIKQVHFILIKWNFYDNYFIDVYTFLKKIHVSGPRDSKL
jgi:hypothetical protein